MAVLVVDELPNNEMNVCVKLYAPGARVYYAVIETEKKSTGWTATRYRSPPK